MREDLLKMELNDAGGGRVMAQNARTQPILVDTANTSPVNHRFPWAVCLVPGAQQIYCMPNTVFIVDVGRVKAALFVQYRSP